ncbi:MAG: hypothetical protein QM621_11900 [Aeromicrobium sp.]|uniref:hypothetical protein n=1 Tax=Aeromicrobium sp. TaxID=1871063 RepID=UPI0039E585EF
MRSAEQFDADFREWRSSLTPSERAAIAAWQGVDRRYQRIQAVISGSADASPADAKVARDLLSAIRKGAIRRPTVLWRGVRSSTSAFGLPASELGNLAGARRRVDRFFAASLSRQVATTEFTAPPLLGGPALMRVTVAPGSRAAWIAGAGETSLRDQFEVLLRPRLVLHLTRVEYPDGGLPVLHVEATDS